MIADTTIIFFGASVAVCTFALVTFFVVVSYHKALKKQKELQEELDALKLEGNQEVNKILLTAQTEAAQIIKNAQIKSQEFINASEIFSGEFKGKFQQSILSGSNQMLQNVSKDISGEVGKAMTSFSQTLAKHMEAALSKVQSELEEYKKQKMEQVNLQIGKIVKDTTKRAVGEALNAEQHEKAIMKALEEAKKQNVL